MNKIIVFLIFFPNLSAWADSSAFPKYVCSEYDRSAQQLLDTTVVLTPTGPTTDLLDDEGEYVAMQTPYNIEVFKGVRTIAELEASGLVTSEDVHFSFESEDGELQFFIYLDEMEESSLTLFKDGTPVSDRDFVCR